MAGERKKIGILVVAYNVSAHLARTLDRIPGDFRSRVSEVLVCDNHSEDPTYLVGLGYQQTARDLPLTVIRHDRNLGYGGNQKAGYRWAIDHDLDIVVLLHGDGQYAPEFLPQIVAPLERGECDAVFGSRMMNPGGARKGGMPLYKQVGNRVLTAFENAMVGLDLSEWHSGYRAFQVDTLRDIPFEANTDEYDFDSQIIIQLHEAGKRIVELPIPTYYGDEISYVNGMRYARDIAIGVTRYRLHKAGLGSGDGVVAGTAPASAPATAHDRVLTWLAGRTPARVLCLTRPGDNDGDGATGAGLANRLGALDHEVSVRALALDGSLPLSTADPFDLVVAVDVVESVPDPERLLIDAGNQLTTRGSMVVVVSNFGHWYARARVAAGAFDYDQRGVLGRNHLRFFTRGSFERLAGRAGFVVARREAIADPPADRLGVAVRPTLFASQFLYELDRSTSR